MSDMEDKKKLFSDDDSLWSGKYSDTPELQTAYNKGVKDGFLKAFYLIIIGDVRMNLSAKKIKSRNRKTIKKVLNHLSKNKWRNRYGRFI